MIKAAWCLGTGFVALLAVAAWGDDPALTIYNQNFGVVRETVPLDLKQGANTVSYSGGSAHIEPDSVIPARPNGQTPAPNPGAELPGRPCFASAAVVGSTKVRPSISLSRAERSRTQSRERSSAAATFPTSPAQRQYGQQYYMAQASRHARPCRRGGHRSRRQDPLWVAGPTPVSFAAGRHHTQAHLNLDSEQR